MITIHATKKLYAHLPVDDQGYLAAGKRVVKAKTEPSPSGRGQGEGVQTNALPYLSPLTLREREQNPLSGWHANLITLQRRNCVLLAPCRFDTECKRSVQGTMNQMVGDIEHMLRFDHAKLDDICSYRTGAWLADRPCTVKGQKDCIWPQKAMLALLTEAGRGVDSASVKNNIVHLGSRDG